MTSVTGLLGDIAIVRANPASVARAVAIALAESRVEFGGTAAFVDDAEPEIAAPLPLVRVVFTPATPSDAPVLEVPMNEEPVALGRPDTGNSKPAHAPPNAFVFGRS